MMASANIAASVRQRLLNLARAENRPFNELLQYYAMERFLYRLSRSGHSERFILKGALMLRVWNSPAQRPTMDIDLLGRTSNRPEDVSEVIREIMDVEVEADGLVYSPASVRAERITEDAEYDGIRIRFEARLDTARIFMQVDIGFGDVVHPAPVAAELPTILGNRAPRLLCYSRESVIAEKLEAMVRHGELNSRMKDFYDLWQLSKQYDFDGETLAEAVRLTFERRERVRSRSLAAFSSTFIETKQVQWDAFRRRGRIGQAPESFREVVTELEEFLVPVLTSFESADGQQVRRWRWIAAKGWEGREISL